MKLKSPLKTPWRSTATAVSLMLASASWSFAQSKTPAVDQEESIELSPFVVTADDTNGYAATSTLAGTRLKTNLKDLGAAISVVTAQFLEDTGATNIEELLTYTTSTEVGGQFGNYSSAGFNDSAGRADQDEIRRDSQAGARVRGFAKANYTRGYFSTNISGDAYNTEAITFSRGANSLLFGLGSAGGVIENNLKSAVIGRNFGEVGYRIDNFGSQRATADLNQTLISDRLALRVDLLHKTDYYKQEPAFSREKRVYAALNGVVFKNEKIRFMGPTKIRANFEAGESTGTPPSSFAPQLAWAPFFVPPPDFRPYTGVDYAIGGGYEMLAANWRKWAVNDTRGIPDPNNPKNPSGFRPGWFESLAAATANGHPELVAQNHSSSHIFNQIAAVFSSPDHTTPEFGFQGWVSQLPGQNAFTNGFINTRAYMEQGGGAGFKEPTLTNRDIFDYRNYLITGDLQEVNRRWDSSSVTLEQTFFSNKLGFEATLDKQFFYNDYFQPFGGNGRDTPIYIDTTLYLSDGRPNPNVGKAMMISQSQSDQWRTTWRDNQRVTGYYDLDFRDLNDTMGKWFGRHTFTGLWQKESSEFKGMNYNTYWEGADFDMQRGVRAIASNNTNIGSLIQNPVVMFAYLSDDLRGVEESDVRLSPMSLQRIREGQTLTTTYFDLDSTKVGFVAPGSFKTGKVTARRVANGATGSGTDVTSEALAWQSRFFESHLIGLLGWREDTVDSFRTINSNLQDPVTKERLLAATDLNDTAATTQVGRTFTWSAVGHLPESWVQKLPNLISSVSGHYGVGENFQAGGERHGPNNDLIGAPSGTTEEAGITIGFNDDKWALKINRFKSESVDSSVTGTNFPVNSITEVTRPLGNYKDAENGGIAFQNLSSYPALAAAGYSSYEQLYAAIKNFIPQPARAIYDYQYTDGAWRLPVQPGGGTGIAGLSATTDTVAKGWEVEMTANPTRNLRISGNVVQVEATNDNSATPYLDLTSQYMANMVAAKLHNVVEGPASITTMEGRYVASYINPLVSLRSKDGAASQELREYRANLVANYTFSEGRFKGFGIGAAARWQSDVTIGYHTQLVNGLQLPLLDRPVKGPSELNGDMWLSYRRKLTEKIDWRVQLNFRNLVGSQDDIPTASDADGYISVYRIPPVKSWYLSNTFSF